MFYYKNRKKWKLKKRTTSKYKSSLEKRFAELAQKLELNFTYESDKIPYVVPSHYLPDFKIAPNRYVETKGYFSSSNRQRMLCFKEQHPEIDICFMFGNADNKLNAKSTTTYREWSLKHGFKCADIKDGLPKNWWKINDRKKVAKTKP